MLLLIHSWHLHATFKQQRAAKFIQPDWFYSQKLFDLFYTVESWNVSLMLSWKLFYIRPVLFLSFLNSLKCRGFSFVFLLFSKAWLKSSLTNSVQVLYISDQSCARRRDLQRTVQSNADVHCQILRYFRQFWNPGQENEDKWSLWIRIKDNYISV